RPGSAGPGGAFGVGDVALIVDPPVCLRTARSWKEGDRGEQCQDRSDPVGHGSHPTMARESGAGGSEAPGPQRSNFARKSWTSGAGAFRAAREATATRASRAKSSYFAWAYSTRASARRPPASSAKS